MNSEERRREIYKILAERDTAISAAVLAERFNVTRQIIVKDIALLKAEKTDILSTAKGYILNKGEAGSVRKMVQVCHDVESIEDELNTVVDLGGRVLTTAVEHPVYGIVGEALNIRSRREVKKFLENISKSGCEPLLRLTNGKHMHLIEADDEECMEEICAELKGKGYLIL
ncbi:MAG: transcription repressor NadR [Lachnospiraceae bacterium]|nr:transcription repressor NadR [Lachnospiraceae bacterium]